MKRQVLGMFLLFAILAATLSVQAGMLGPGTYDGYFNVTRWGNKVFHLGPYHFFVSDSAAQRLEKYRGIPLRLKVSKISQPMNPGAGMIQDFEEVTTYDVASGLTLSATLKNDKPLQGEGIQLTLSLRNDSEEPITIMPGTLAIALVTDSPFSNEDIGYKDPNDCAYWYYSHWYHSFEEGKEHLRIACRPITLPWSGQDLVSKGHNIHVADKNRGFDGPIIIEPQGSFQADYNAGKELLPDDYEVFFYHILGDRTSFPGRKLAMSERLPFDVIERDHNTDRPTVNFSTSGNPTDRCY
jgi:hypothetical protein